MTEFSKIIAARNVTKTIAVGTAALRDASNKKPFLEVCRQKTGITIDLIDGEREAELIWKAARYCVKLNTKYLVMDIGGGSNEFIIADNNRIYWKKSYRLGLSRLKETFKLSESSTAVQQEIIATFLTDKLADLFEACESHDVHHMIGTAGTFDTYANVFSIKHEGVEFDFNLKNYSFNTSELLAFCDDYNKMSFENRNKVEGIPDFRKEFMIYATLLTAVVMRHCNIQNTYLSSYALKEGVFIESFGL